MAVTCRPGTFGSCAAPVRQAEAGEDEVGAGEDEDEDEGAREGEGEAERPATVGVRLVGWLAADVAADVG
jgi:hypothetical protein